MLRNIIQKKNFFIQNKKMENFRFQHIKKNEKK